MAKSSIRSYQQFELMNGSVLDISQTDIQHLLLVNNTLLHVRLQEPFRDSQLNELLYVIIVIVFYATALMTLIITQIKRQRREGTEVDYYDEYLQRNSEVKQTCQTATKLVTRSSRPPPALATAAFAAAAAGTLLGRVPILPDDVNENLLSETDETRENIDTHRGGNLGVCGELGHVRVIYPREKSPMRDKTLMLESIPDEEA
ncbi:hypothetical protein BgiMline_013625 [Biomphalaria glabrata]|uniref:Uncharacterized protein n=2 Tax=Biomphalaria TaxID=6525 RepID=A0A2C9KQV9_BIOGL|nr:hypothetical protein BgiMline_012450 [Biomphalaria glabrata]KAI8773786.1 hypothetical protein BgiBS90_024971 [Biomphalaria glabrata]KAK0069653.1 hypothetical protein Bpfe_000830 [Biomphalaria pfeifferi]